MNKSGNKALISAFANKVNGKTLYKLVAIVNTQLHSLNKVVVMLFRK